MTTPVSYPNQQNRVWSPATTDWGYSLFEPLLQVGDLYFNTVTNSLRQCLDPSTTPAEWAYVSDTNLGLVSGFDEFNEPTPLSWSTALAFNGTVLVSSEGPGGATFASSGVLKLGVTTDVGSKAEAWRYDTSFRRNMNPVLEFRFSADPTYDEFEYAYGISDGTGLAGNCVLAYYGWSGGVPAYALQVITGGSVGISAVAFALPALGLATGYRSRLSVTSVGAVLELATDNGPYSTVASLTDAIPDVLYTPYTVALKGALAGGRTLVLDYVKWNASRY